MEYTKFASRREPYHKALADIQQLDFSFYDYIHHSPAFTGHMNIARFLALYEAYKMTLGLAGHIAEVGVWKAASLLFFAKLTQIFEPNSLTLVHGFDWYKGMSPGVDEAGRTAHLWQESLGSREETRARTDQEALELYNKVKTLIEVQGLGNIAYLHKLDVTKELDRFFSEYPHLQFKLVFLDAGTYEVTKSCLPHFWPRLVSGGILILDQFNHEMGPGETRAVREYLPDIPIHTFVFATQPSGYIIKPSRT